MGCGASKPTKVEPQQQAKTADEAAQQQAPLPAADPKPKAEPAAEERKPTEETPTPMPEPEPAKPAVAEEKPAPVPQAAPKEPEPEAKAEEPKPEEVAPPEPAAPAVDENALPMEDKQLIFVIGGPGTGATEQCAKLVETYKCNHLVMGSLMRAEVLSESADGKSIGQMINDGKIIPAPVYATLFGKAISGTRVDKADKGSPSAAFLLDGFPRSADNAKLFEEQVGKPSAAIVLSVPEAIALERLKDKAPAAGKDLAAEEAANAKRMAAYAKRTVPMVAALEKGGLPVHHVNAAADDALVLKAMAVALGWAEGPAPPETVVEGAGAAGGDEDSKLVPSFSFHPAENTKLASVTGAKAGGRPAPDTRKAIVVLGDKTEVMAAACAKLRADHGYTEVALSAVLEAEIAAGSPEGVALKADVDAGKLIDPARAGQLLDAYMKEEGPYVIKGTGAAMGVLNLLSRTRGLAPQAFCFGAPADGEAPLAAAYKAGGRELHDVTAEEGGAAADEMLTTLGADGAASSAAASMPQAKDVIFVLGGPGSGKGTQCALLAQHLGYTHFSAGDLLRAEVESGSAQGVMIEEMIKEGKIVPAQTTIDLLKKAMGAQAGPYLIDGFPRSMDNVKAFEDQVGVPPNVLFFDVSEEVLEARLLERAKTSGRADDNKESIMKRFKTFQSQSLPVVEYLATISKVHKIKGEGGKAQVFAEVCAALGHTPPELPAEDAPTAE